MTLYYQKDLCNFVPLLLTLIKKLFKQMRVPKKISKFELQ